MDNVDSGKAEVEGGKDAGSGSKINATIDAVTGLVKAVPVYQDTVQPAAKELGKSLQTVARAVNVALMPLKGIVWSFEKIEALFLPKVEQRLRDVPPEDIITPKANVAGPALEALRYAGDEESLSDMYANLLASAMDKNTANGAHPAFVEIIKQLTSDEAKLMRLFVERQIPFPIVNVKSAEKEEADTYWYHKVRVSLLGEAASVDLIDFTPSYLDNLTRLGLIDIRNNWAYSDLGLYDLLENSEKVAELQKEIEEEQRSFSLERGAVTLTNLGEQFGEICIFRKPLAAGGQAIPEPD